MRALETTLNNYSADLSSGRAEHATLQVTTNNTRNANMWVFQCVGVWGKGECVCVCVREREKERERVRVKEKCREYLNINERDRACEMSRYRSCHTCGGGVGASAGVAPADAPE